MRLNVHFVFSQRSRKHFLNYEIPTVHIRPNVPTRHVVFTGLNQRALNSSVTPRLSEISQPTFFCPSIPIDIGQQEDIYVRAIREKLKQW